MSKTKTEVKVRIDCSSVSYFEAEVESKIDSAISKIYRGFKELDGIKHFPHRHLWVNGTFCDLSLTETPRVNQLQHAMQLLGGSR